MISIKVLNSFSHQKQLSFGFNGYLSTEFYELSRSVTPNGFRFELGRTALKEAYTKQWTYTTQDSLHYQELISQGLSFGAYENDLLVGVAITEKKSWNNSLWLDYLEIADTYRKKGIGTLLLDHLTQTAKAHKFRLIELEVQNTNVPAIDFYFKNGFELSGLHLSLYDPSEVSTLEKALFLSKIL
eukprot:gene14637-17311_t